MPVEFERVHANAEEDPLERHLSPRIPGQVARLYERTTEPGAPVCKVK